jgi:hypothetical protein
MSDQGDRDLRFAVEAWRDEVARRRQRDGHDRAEALALAELEVAEQLETFRGVCVELDLEGSAEAPAWSVAVRDGRLCVLLGGEVMASRSLPRSPDGEHRTGLRDAEWACRTMNRFAYDHARGTRPLSRETPRAPRFVVVSSTVDRSHYIFDSDLGAGSHPVRRFGPDSLGHAEAVCRELNDRAAGHVPGLIAQAGVKPTGTDYQGYNPEEPAR